MRRSSRVLGGLLLACSFGAFAQPARTLDVDAARREAAALLEQGRTLEARPLLEQIVAVDPGDHVSLYNLACVRLRAGERDGAEDALRRAIGVGFVDFHQMLRDPDLAALRESDTVRLVLRDWARVLDVRGEADVKAAKEALGAGYTHVRDEALRVHILSAFNEAATGAAHDEIRRAAKFVDERMFEIDAPAGRPDPWTLVILPTRTHFRVFVPFDGVGGVYDHDRRRLVTRDLGPSLRHEFVHVLHHRRMMRLGQRHAFWLQEGLASLAERLVERPGGEVRPRVNWRINIARRLAAPRRLMPWDRFFTLDGTTFVTTRPLAMYAQAYATTLWLHETNALRRWLEAYEAGFDEDPAGLIAFARVGGASAEDAQRAWRDWIVAQESVPERFVDGMVSLGVDLAEGDQEGPRVVGAFAPRPSGRESLRLRDVVLSIDGAPVRTVAEAIEALEDRGAGQTVEVDIRRGRLELTVEVTLVAFDSRASRGMAERLR